MRYVRKEPRKDEGDHEKVERELKFIIKQADDTLRDEDLATAFATQKGLSSGAHEGFLYGRNELAPNISTNGWTGICQSIQRYRSQ